MNPRQLLCLCAAVGVSACAHTPPKELVDARTAYKQAASGVAQSEDPAALHTAEQALARAEQTFDDEGDSQHARDQAYVALRKAQLADVQARIGANERRLAQVEQQADAAQNAEIKQLRGQYANSQQQLAAEQAAHAEAEQRAQKAAADLAQVASVKQEPRGMVITLSGEVLFASGKSELLPSARGKLDEVAKALTQGEPDTHIVVEGHTDSTGSEAMNLELSRRRAQAVGDYLSAHGVPRDRIRAEGVGFAKPLADNKTAAGRANNRRVEIVVQPPVAGESG
ncbi:MAG: OmpA family protein [Polyangiales bacterium]